MLGASSDLIASRSSFPPLDRQNCSTRNNLRLVTRLRLRRLEGRARQKTKLAPMSSIAAQATQSIPGPQTLLIEQNATSPLQQETFSSGLHAERLKTTDQPPYFSNISLAHIPSLDPETCHLLHPQGCVKKASILQSG